MTFPRRGLYVITDPDLIAPGRLENAVEAALSGGATIVQYRTKSEDKLRRQREADALAKLCRAASLPLVVNDDVELARNVAADGVHLGRDDASITAARRALGPRAIIGVSCYSSAERALSAQAEGAEYVAFGSFFPSRTKARTEHADPELLREVRPKLRLPIVAIGGITPDNGAELLAAGADFLAVIHGVFSHEDPQSAARAYARLFE